jgi:hypothetical protein
MRILRLSFLRQFFLLSKNVKKALLVINIGIFLSIFAATSASISFYIEKKINEKEFLLIENQQGQRGMSNTLTIFTSVLTLVDTMMNNETSRVDASSLSSMTNFGDKILSNKDFYLPVIFTSIKDIEILSEIMDEKFSFEIDGVTKEINMLEWLLFLIQSWPEEDIKEFETLIDEFKLTGDELEKINISIYEDAIFHSTYLDLLEEINNSDNNSINNYEHKIYKDYKTAMDFNYVLIDLLKETGSIFRGMESDYVDEIKKLNSEISKLSDLEKNIILFAFILQFIIFIIIQFFEISSVNREINKKK